jgi:prepilin-type N-terminal cleavage/methylation domain-containing protein
VETGNGEAGVNRRQGYTLIELSIVLVIIGLVVGSVVVGRDLIASAENREVIAYRDKLLTAIQTFRLKYNALPGDMRNAENIWGTDPGGCPNTPANSVPKTATCNGDGDGVVDSYYVPGNYTSIQYAREAQRFWQHLANAGMISGQYSGAPYSVNSYSQQIGISAPAMSFNKSVGISNFGHINAIITYSWYFPVYYHMVFYVGTQYPDVTTLSPFISPIRAYGIDTKIDDGAPGRGRIMSLSSDAIPQPNCVSSNNQTSATYLVEQTGPNCTILFNERVN